MSNNLKNHHADIENNDPYERPPYNDSRGQYTLK